MKIVNKKSAVIAFLIFICLAAYWVYTIESVKENNIDKKQVDRWKDKEWIIKAP